MTSDPGNDRDRIGDRIGEPTADLIAEAGGLIIDCDSCTVRGFGCDDCVISALIGYPGDEESLGLDAEETRALDVLADGGLVPPLRLTPRSSAS